MFDNFFFIVRKLFYTVYTVNSINNMFVFYSVYSIEQFEFKKMCIQI